MTCSLQNKIALVTGSTDGVGKLTAVELAKAGSNVIIHGRNKEKAIQVHNELKKINPECHHKILICDFNEPQQITNKFSLIKKLDILINNAGIWNEGATLNLTPERAIALVNVNLTSAIVATRVLLPALLKSEFGQILNVISRAGYNIPEDHNRSVYTATKFGLKGFSESLTKEFYNTNLRVMGIYPGGMETDLFEKAGNTTKKQDPDNFNPQETADLIMFMLKANPEINIKRLDIENHKQKS